MKESETPLPNIKGDQNAIREYFRNVYPEMDEERVYTSDMKKMVKWFEILKGADLLDFSAMAEAPTEDAEGTTIEGEAQVAEHEKAGDTTPTNLFGEADEAKPAKKARAKKATTTEEGGEEKPAKKTAKKKAEGAEGEAAPKKTAKAKKEAE
jgi:hypothetical protein